MDLKTKVIRISVIVACLIAIGLIGYLTFFIVKDTLKPPPENAVIKNLFIEKDSLNIAHLKKTRNINENKLLYDSTSLSMKEDSINGFITDEQYLSLWKKLNYTYIEQFIALANIYFSQRDWRNNNFVNDKIAEIKHNGFVERNTPIWNKLMGYENSIVWYNSTQNCISRIQSLINSEHYFYDNNLSELIQCKNNLNSQNCRKNTYKLSELNNAYENLKNKSYSYLDAKIDQYGRDFNNNKETYLRKAYSNYDEGKKEVGQWNAVFNGGGGLDSKLKNYKNKIDYYYLGN